MAGAFTRRPSRPMGARPVVIFLDRRVRYPGPEPARNRGDGVTCTAVVAVNRALQLPNRVAAAHPQLWIGQTNGCCDGHPAGHLGHLRHAAPVRWHGRRRRCAAADRRVACSLAAAAEAVSLSHVWAEIGWQTGPQRPPAPPQTPRRPTSKPHFLAWDRSWKCFVFRAQMPSAVSERASGICASSPPRDSVTGYLAGSPLLRAYLT